MYIISDESIRPASREQSTIAARIFEYLENGESPDDFLEGFPTVSRVLAVQVLEESRELRLGSGGTARTDSTLKLGFLSEAYAAKSPLPHREWEVRFPGLRRSN
jgi:hypothetical protein